MSDDRRLHARTPQDFAVRLDGPQGRQRLVARDLSAGGVFIEIARPYRIGERVEVRVEVEIDGAKEWLEMEAEVRHHTNTYQTDDGRGPYRGMGLRFIRFDADQQARLLAFLAGASG